MQTKRRDLFTAVRTEGAILPPDLLQRIADGDRGLEGLKPEDFHRPGERLNEVINAAWNRLLGHWQSFQAALAKLPENDPATSATRERWLLPLFRELDYGRLAATPAIEIDGKSYPISHGWQKTPIHLVGWHIDLDRRTAGVAGAARTSPHSLVQELLNRCSDRLWGFVSNGRRLRILRDNVSLTRQAFVEFDVEAMMNGEVYADFALLWLLCHQSRVEAERPEQCWLEKWSRAAQDSGTRALDSLRQGVEEAIKALGGGFLAHPANTVLRQKLRAGAQQDGLDTQEYYRQVLRLVYRLLFLFAAEDRNLLLIPSAEDKTRETYARYYSTARLRHFAERHRGTRHCDLYQGLTLVMQKLGAPGGCPELGLPALGSFLWSDRAMPALADCRIANSDFLSAIRALAFTIDGNVLRAVDYKNLGAEELGSVYESLLELHPKLNTDAATFELDVAAGHERKTTGSYYTPTSLINCLLDSALEPVLDEAVKGSRESGVESREKKTPSPSSPTPHSPLPTPSPSTPEERILNLKICDPACGSGHFLIAAAHRIAKRLAAVRTGDEEPAPEAYRQAMRDVIGRCIFGVDINAMAVELCKINLWLESLEPGKPLSFLDHHIQCGNSLLGATPALLQKGIPDEAFEPIEGDDKKLWKEYKKHNRDERRGQQRFDFDRPAKPWERLGNAAVLMANLDTMDDDSLESIRHKEERYTQLVASADYLSGRFWADTWCAAFVWKKTKEFDYAITEDVFRRIERNPHDCAPWMRAEIERLARQYQFFHWHLAFPQVFHIRAANASPDNEHTGWCGGFDVVLGNPPWEKINLKLEEYFAQRKPEIAFAGTKARRQALIEQLAVEDPIAYAEYLETARFHDGLSHYFRDSGAFPTTGISRINLYSIFAERGAQVLADRGCLGMILPTGIATDHNNKDLFFGLAKSRRLLGVFDFENRGIFFPDVHAQFRFCLLIFAGSSSDICPRFGFFLTAATDLQDNGKTFELSSDDLELLSPESGTAPIFKNAREAKIAGHLYRTHGILSAWQDRIGVPQTPFNMANDSRLFQPFDARCAQQLLPLLEGKHIGPFNWRAARGSDADPENVVASQATDLERPDWFGVTRHSVKATIVAERYPADFRLVYRKITNATNERTTIAALAPPVAVGDTLTQFRNTSPAWCLYCAACMNSLAFDFVARIRMSGTSLTHWIVKQIPIPEPQASGTLTKAFVDQRSLELSSTDALVADALRECCSQSLIFRWNKRRRDVLRCELDAAFFLLYGVERDDVDYIMETFPIVKRRDEEQHGEYRTKRVILEIYDRMVEAIRTGQPYQTLLDPPPGPPRDPAGSFIPMDQWDTDAWPKHIHRPRE